MQMTVRKVEEIRESSWGGNHFDGWRLRVKFKVHEVMAIKRKLLRRVKLFIISSRIPPILQYNSNQLQLHFVILADEHMHSLSYFSSDI